MDRRLWLAMVGVAGLILVAVAQKPETQAGLSGARYQIVAADQGQEGKIVFMLDTQVGNVWKYQPVIAGSGDRPTIPEAFVLVGFGMPHEGAPNFDLSRSASEDRRQLKK